MNILDKIIARKRDEVVERKKLVPIEVLEKSEFFGRKPFSMKSYIMRADKSGIIAEFKRRSPSKGDINPTVTVADVTTGYVKAGASALSVLTDTDFFGGKTEDLIAARRLNEAPIIRKDFMIDEYQVFEAKAMGADAILLIAAVLTPAEIVFLGQKAHDLGMEALLEVHDLEELQRSITPHVDMIGVNNRNLKTFSTSIQTSMDLVEHIPNEFVKVSESGISNAQTILQLKEFGYKGFLIGENFMKTANPGQACEAFVNEIMQLESR